MLTLRNGFLPTNTKLNNLLDDFFTYPLLTDWDIPNLTKSNFTTNETESSYEVELAIPGLSKEDIHIETKDGNLTISYETKNKNSFISSSYKKSFIIPEDVNTNKIKATTDNGILKIVFPKKENSKAKIIEVQ
jgi:HSP20 family protein